MSSINGLQAIAFIRLAARHCFALAQKLHRDSIHLRGCTLGNNVAAIVYLTTIILRAASPQSPPPSRGARYFVSIDGSADTADAVLGDTTAIGGGSADSNADDVAPGVLSSGLRAALGIAAAAPPPWLARMKLLGYPPGYLAPEDGEASSTGEQTHMISAKDWKPIIHACRASIRGAFSCLGFEARQTCMH